MLNDAEIATSVQEESDPVDDETDEDENNNNESSKGPSTADGFLRLRQQWSGTNINQSAVQLNYCCARESETLHGKTKCPVSYTAWIAVGVRLSELCPVPIDSDKRRSTVIFPYRIETNKKIADGSGFELVTKPATIRYLDHSATTAYLHVMRHPDGILVSDAACSAVEPRTAEVDMPLRRFLRQYEQLSQFERGRIIGMMEAGWSARRVARQLDRSDCVRRESRFNLSSNDNSVRVWRHCGERLNPAFALQRYTAPTAGVMVWGVIACNTRSPLVLIRGTMTAQRVSHAVTTLPWPTRSPDSSPIEHIRDHLGRRGGHPTSLNELEARLQQICNEMSQDII
ncbi:transposable element Tcb2 transposase [Trichonephila clavipes]|nr:transposable element Tcb2 transposase [Trichonephila clavipes]